MGELERERARFSSEKNKWREERDAWAHDRIDAGIKTKELELYATCLEKGINIEHHRRQKVEKSVEEEKRKLKRALDRNLRTQEELNRKDQVVKDFKHTRRMETQRIRRTKLSQAQKNTNRHCYPPPLPLLHTRHLLRSIHLYVYQSVCLVWISRRKSFGPCRLSLKNTKMKWSSFAVRSKPAKICAPRKEIM